MVSAPRLVLSLRSNRSPQGSRRCAGSPPPRCRVHDRHVKLHLPILGEAGWRTLVEQVKDYAIFMLDTEPRNISWNEGVERVFGYAEAEFVGQSASDIFTPEDRAAGEVEREFGEAAA